MHTCMRKCSGTFTSTVRLTSTRSWQPKVVLCHQQHQANMRTGSNERVKDCCRVHLSQTLSMHIAADTASIFHRWRG
jgi:hypothetical protein